MRVHNQILINLNKAELSEAEWKRLAGPRKYKSMEDKYENDLKIYLFPLLEKHSIKMTERPLQNTPGKQSYLGFDKDYNKILFTFTNQNKDKEDYREGKRDLLCNISYNGKSKDAGVMLVNNRENAENALELILMTLESMSDEPKEEKSNIEDYGDLDALAKFNGMS